MKRPGIFYLSLATVCILIVCVGIVSATQMIRPIADGTHSNGFSQKGCNLTAPASMNPMLTHKGYQALNRTVKIPGIMMNKTDRGYHSTARFLQRGNITPDGGLINNAGAYNPGPANAIPEENCVNGTGVKKSLINTNRTGIRPGFTRDGQTHRDEMMFQLKNQSVSVPLP